jgi:hypothetical protein
LPTRPPASEASREINRLRGIRRTPRADVARERRQIADDMATRRGDGATPVREARRGRGLHRPDDRASPASDPADFAGAFAYEHTDVPPDVTLTDCRRARQRRPARRRPLRALVRRLRPERRSRPEARR